MRGDPEDPLERRLGALVRDWPDLAGAADVYRVTLPLLREAGPLAAPIALTEERARRKMSEGEYLLHGATLVFDHRGARELMLGLARNLEEAGLVAMSPIRSALEGDRLVLEELLGHVSDGDYPSLAARRKRRRSTPLSCGRWPNPRSSPPSGPGAWNWRLSSTPQASGRRPAVSSAAPPPLLANLRNF